MEEREISVSNVRNAKESNKNQTKIDNHKARERENTKQGLPCNVQHVYSVITVTVMA